MGSGKIFRPDLTVDIPEEKNRAICLMDFVAGRCESFCVLL